MALISDQILQKGISKLKREFVGLPLVSDINDKIYQRRLLDHSHRLPYLTDQGRRILSAMNQHGVFSTHVSELAFPEAEKAMEIAKNLLENARPDDGSEDKISISSEILNQQPELLLWAANESLLDIVENYIGLPIYYLGVEVRQEFANGKTTGVRQWHLDPEDRRMLKIIIYLNDVDIDGGPFEYISQELTKTAAKQLRYRSGLVPDQTMASVVPESLWNACTGPRGTITFVDTCNIFHRAKPPCTKDRLSITYHYTSQYPIEFRSVNIFSSQPCIREKLTERQLMSVVQDSKK